MCIQRGVLWRILVYRGMRKYRSVKLRKMPQTCGGYGENPWLRGLNMGRTREVLDLLSLGKSIEKILQRYPV